jgi:hypothetical protein
MTVKLVGSTSGSVSLQAPASTTGGAHRVLTLPDADGTVATTATAGKILQVVQTVKKDSFSADNNGSFGEITGLNVTLTPTSSSNKILFTLDITYSVENGNNFYVKLYDGSSEITGATSTTGSSNNGWIGTYITGSTTNMISDQMINVSKSYLHTVSDTNAHTYKIYAHAATALFYINRSENSGGAGSTSVLTAMEVAA